MCLFYSLGTQVAILGCGALEGGSGIQVPRNRYLGEQRQATASSWLVISLNELCPQHCPHFAKLPHPISHSESPVSSHGAQ